MWIWSNSRQDFQWLYLPGLLAIAASFFLTESSSSIAFLVFAFIAKEFLDSGHVYTTLWRTYLNPSERYRTRVYIFAPLLIFSVFFAWAYSGMAYLGTFVVYATIFHNVRQFYGISKWYQKLNGVFRVDSDRLFSALCFLPFFIAHFRTGEIWNSFSSGGGALRWPNELLYQRLLWGYLAIILIWIGYEVSIMRRHREWNRLLSVAFPAAVYGFCFLHGRTMTEVLFPLVVSHGVAYIGLVSLSLKRTQRFPSLAQWTIILVFLTALVFGLLESVFERQLNSSSPVFAALVALYLTPLFCHYWFDAFLWRSQHPESAQIYGPRSASSGSGLHSAGNRI